MSRWDLIVKFAPVAAKVVKGVGFALQWLGKGVCRAADWLGELYEAIEAKGKEGK